MLRTDLKHDYVRSHARLLGDERADDDRRIGRLARDMRAEARAALEAEGIPAARQRLRYRMDLRYLGQYHEVTVDVPESAIARADWRRVRELFHARHDQLYGYSLSEEGTPVELLNIRLAAMGSPASRRCAPRRAAGRIAAPP